MHIKEFWWSKEIWKRNFRGNSQAQSLSHPPSHWPTTHSHTHLRTQPLTRSPTHTGTHSLTLRFHIFNLHFLMECLHMFARKLRFHNFNLSFLKDNSHEIRSREIADEQNPTLCKKQSCPGGRNRFGSAPQWNRRCKGFPACSFQRNLFSFAICRFDFAKEWLRPQCSALLLRT